ncbi:hypothetical protein K438DRAFT_1834054 [Mycena galopus ATCC 62051]|nr:hypothetical protein K438DRAFT_1834054 [Mycena galopus ATCC 62051]
MEHLVDSALFDLYWKLMLREISGTCVQIFLYAIFLILWIIAIRTLGRRETAGKTVLLTFSWALAALGTTQVVLCIPITVETLRLLHELVQQRTDLNPGPVPAPQLRTYNSLEVAEEVVFVINNLTADLLFLYRCYVIWGRQKKVLILPGVFMISTVAVGGVASTQDLGPTFTVGYSMAAATNLTLVAFTAGRIWLKRRDAIHIDTDSPLKNRYRTVLAMIVESGALYSLFAILGAVTSQFEQSANGDVVHNVISAASAQGMNILPTLIIVRAGMGRNIQDRIESSRAPRRTPARSRAVEWEGSSYEVLDIKPSSEQRAAENSSTIV